MSGTVLGTVDIGINKWGRQTGFSAVTLWSHNRTSKKMNKQGTHQLYIPNIKTE